MRASDLEAALVPFRGVIDNRVTIPILSYVRLTASDDLTIFGSDLDHELAWRLPYEGPAFDVAVPFAPLLKAVTSAGDADIILMAVDGTFVVAGPVTFTFRTLDVEDYPSIATPNGEPVEFRLPAHMLESALVATGPAISTEETRYYLNGVCLQRIDGEIGFTATDGHRLHMVRHPAPEGMGEIGQAIVHRKVVKVMRQLLDMVMAEDVQCRIWERDHRVRFAIGPAIINTKIIDGPYPDYSRVVPASTTGTFAIMADELLRALVGVEGITTERIRTVRLGCADQTLSTKDIEYGTAMARLDAEKHGRLPDAIGFNSRYLSEVLRQRYGSRALLRMTHDAAAPVLIEFEDDPTFRAVLMPMKL